MRDSDPVSRPTGKTVLFVANTDWYLYNFRLSLIKTSVKNGWHPSLVCSKGRYVEKLRAYRWPIRALSLSTLGANPAREAWALLQLVRTYRAAQPDVVHLFTLKCVLYGCLASPFAPRARIIGALTGMGYLFTSHRLSARILKQVVLGTLHVALRISKAHLIFQNEFDRTEFVANRLLPQNRTSVIRGSGVNCAQFNPDKRRPSESGVVRLLFCGRLIAEKGIKDYLEATSELSRRQLPFESKIAGELYPGNPSSLSAKELAILKRSNDHTYIEHHDDMPALLAETDIVVLPTYYREGTPKVLLEAAATACILVTTPIPACEGLVVEGRNGFLVEPRSPSDLADILARLINMSSHERERMGRASRQIAVTDFNETHVNARTIALYED